MCNLCYDFGNSAYDSMPNFSNVEIILKVRSSFFNNNKELNIIALYRFVLNETLEIYR